MKNFLAAIAVVLFLVVLAFGAFQLGAFYQRPLAEPMKISMAESTATPIPAKDTKAQDPTKTPAKGVCGETGSLVLLLTGADFSGGVWPMGADLVRLVKINYDEPAIVSVAFPRDLWVQTPGLADQNHPQSRLGLAYHYKKESTPGAEKHRITAATELVAQTLYDNFGVQAEYYFTLQLDNVGEMVDTIGGVPVDLPASITTDRGVTFPAGPQILDGRLSGEFVRGYLPGGDAARRQRQNLYLKALQTKVISAEILGKAPELVKQFDKAIVTDLSPKQLQSLACMSEEVAPDQVKYYEIDETLTSSHEVGEPIPALDPNFEEIIARLKEWLGQ